GLGEAGEIEEIAVGSIAIRHVAVTRLLGYRREDGNPAFTHHFHQLPTAAGEFVFTHATCNTESSIRIDAEYRVETSLRKLDPTSLSRLGGGRPDPAAPRSRSIRPRHTDQCNRDGSAPCSSPRSSSPESGGSRVGKSSS